MKSEITYVITKILEKGDRCFLKSLIDDSGSLQNVFTGELRQADKFDHYESAMEIIENIEYPGFYQIEKIFRLNSDRYAIG